MDPSLRGGNGHHLALARSYGALVGPERLWCAVSRHADRELGLPAKAILPTFRYTMAEASRVRRYGRFPTALAAVGRELKDRLSMGSGTRAVRRLDVEALRARADAGHARSLHARGLQAACSMFNPGRQDRIVFESGDAEQALALAELLEQGGANGACLRFRLMYDDVPRHPTDLTWGSAVARLARAAAGTAPIQFSTETQAFARALETVAGAPVAVRPHPSALEPRPVPDGRNPFILLVPGEVRSDKGLELVRMVADGLRMARKRDVVIRVQGGMAVAGIEPLPSRLDAAAYADAWVGCHAALLLHDPTVYRLRGSGTVCDAVASGRPFVCLEGASLVEWTADGNAIAVPADAARLVEAIRRLIDDHDMFLARTVTARERLVAMMKPEV